MHTNLTPNISSEDAQSALKIIQESAQRGTTLYRYYQSSPYFFLWALVWFLGFGLSDLFPNQVGTIWLSADLFGVIASLVLAKRKRTHKGIGQSVAWRLGGDGGVHRPICFLHFAGV